MTNAAATLTDDDKTRIQAAVKLLDSLNTGDRIRFTFDGAPIAATYQGLYVLRQGRRVVGMELIGQIGTDRRTYHLARVFDLTRAPELTEACTAFVLDPAAADRKVRRCTCGMSERMH